MDAGSCCISQIKVSGEYLINFFLRIEYFLSPLDWRKAIQI